MARSTFNKLAIAVLCSLCLCVWVYKASTRRHNYDLDVVIAWVNGTEELLESYQRVTGQPITQETRTRLREYGMLRFALRSVALNAAFARRVFLVTNGQVPVWWNPDNEHAQIVRHEEIFVTKDLKGKTTPIPNALPTFNSNAIEACLRNIPGVAKYMLYLNDDMIITRPLSIDDFVNRRTGTLRLGMDHGSSPTHLFGMWDRSLDFTNELINKRYHPHALDTKHYLPHHACYILDRDILEHASRVWRKETMETISHHLREPHDLAHPFLVANVAIEEEWGHSRPTTNGIMVHWTNNHTQNAKTWLDIKRRKSCKCVCIQDSFGDKDPDPKAAEDLERKLCTLFPNRSPFEALDAPNPCDKYRRISRP